MEEVKDATTGDVKNSLVELYQVMSEGTVNATDSYNYNVHNVSIMEALDAVARIRKENGELTEKLNVANARLNRAMVNRRDIEEELLTIRKQYESILRDYRETMSERSNVLEENNKLTDERDFFREKFKILASIVQKFFSVVMNLKFK
ncbi:unnamed protein product [Dracunculus medinensis]|uniref:Uncharacterized protein n=1 Tax=Dracunculus medinensis TaxID=318479 RepID=A0A0N4UIV7_DRAME|nr:unnamed protein product [Dracunculus medinensis]